MVIKTWHTTRADGSKRTYERQHDPNSDDLVTITETQSNNSPPTPPATPPPTNPPTSSPANTLATGSTTTTTTTVYVLDNSGAVIRKNSSSATVGSGGFPSQSQGIVLSIVMLVGWLAQLASFGGWVIFGIWAFVLVFIFRKHIRPT